MDENRMPKSLSYFYICYHFIVRVSSVFFFFGLTSLPWFNEGIVAWILYQNKVVDASNSTGPKINDLRCDNFDDSRQVRWAWANLDSEKFVEPKFIKIGCVSETPQCLSFEKKKKKQSSTKSQRSREYDTESVIYRVQNCETWIWGWAQWLLDPSIHLWALLSTVRLPEVWWCLRLLRTTRQRNNEPIKNLLFFFWR